MVRGKTCWLISIVSSWSQIKRDSLSSKRERALAGGPRRRRHVFDPEVHKVSWQQVGRVNEPGRYLFTFGWLTIKLEDIMIWQRFPDAIFTRVIQRANDETDGVEFHLGTFEIPR